MLVTLDPDRALKEQKQLIYMQAKVKTSMINKIYFYIFKTFEIIFNNVLLEYNIFYCYLSKNIIFFLTFCLN